MGDKNRNAMPALVAVMLATTTLAGCANKFIPPDINYDDAAPAEVGNEIRGATIEDAVLALTELGRLHAPVIGNESLADAEWLTRAAPLDQALIGQLWAGFADRYGDAITAE